MLKSKIKTHTIGRQYHQPHFFIVSRGRNVGKPLPDSYANCFVFLADDETDRDFHFQLFRALWEQRYFKPYLVGSIAEFIPIGDFIDITEETINAVNAGERTFMDVAFMMAQIKKQRVALRAQVAYILELRRSLYHTYIKR